jgi:hypothetical protein
VADEDLSGYDETDSGDYLSNPTSTSARATDVPCDATERHFSQDFGSAIVGDFEMNFYAILHGWDNDRDGVGLVWLTTALEQADAATTMLLAFLARKDKRVKLRAGTLDQSNGSWGGGTGEQVWFTLKRTSGTVELESYDGPGWTNEFPSSPQTRTRFTTVMRYLQLCGNIESAVSTSNTWDVTIGGVELVSGFPAGAAEDVLAEMLSRVSRGLDVVAGDMIDEGG